MKLLTTIFCILTFIKGADSQDLIRRTDSLIGTIESSGNFVSRNYCDTFLASHSDYFHSDCVEYHSFENKFMRIIRKHDRFNMFHFYDSLYNQIPERTGTISIDTFYFYNDTFIKATRVNNNRPPLFITHFYLTGNDLAYMKERGWTGSDEYNRVEFCIGLANELLSNFKRNK